MEQKEIDKLVDAYLAWNNDIYESIVKKQILQVKLKEFELKKTLNYKQELLLLELTHEYEVLKYKLIEEVIHYLKNQYQETDKF